MSNAPDVSTRQPSLAALEEKRTLVRDLCGGTPAMQAAGNKWLPKYSGEHEENYKTRLTGNVLTNFVEQAVTKAVGKIFSKPIQVDEKVPQDIQDILENIDRQGNGLDSFIRDRYKKAFEDGISYALCDTPKAEGVQTKADEKALGMRPYAVAVNADCLLEVMAEMIGGVETLTRIRIMESVSAPDGEWGFKSIPQVRVLKRVIVKDDKGQESPVIIYQLWRQSDAVAGAKPDWILFDFGNTTLKRITPRTVLHEPLRIHAGGTAVSGYARLRWQRLERAVGGPFRDCALGRRRGG